MPTVFGEASTEIAADARTAWNLLVDAAAYPTWYETLDEVVVEQTDASGRPVTIDVRSDVPPLGSARFRLELAYTDGELLTATQVGPGSLVKDIRSEWRVEQLAPGRSRVTYRLQAGSDGLKAAAAFRAAEARVRRHLVDGFVAALRERAERG